MKDVRFVLLNVILGGAFFWAPVVLLLSRPLESKGGFIMVTFTCPLALVGFYSVALSRRRGRSGGPSSALFALLGVWVIGPWFMALAGTLAGGPGLHNVTDYIPLLLMSVCPPLTLYLSFMQGNAFALILATILMLVCHRVFERGRWLIPPGWKRRLHFRHRQTS